MTEDTATIDACVGLDLNSDSASERMEFQRLVVSVIRMLMKNSL
jgi:hypothetical protein